MFLAKGSGRWGGVALDSRCLAAFAFPLLDQQTADDEPKPIKVDG
ncbi:hypothetical protein JCM19237_4683 [Photobacterium aphoticum]|uniref:Uncharacterized protein n=1 Tax=Photobacterium aphoticum TaxID=754436 RepID=A0A090QR20_9GAMM|nr:hypothetical protein JCM19237_4683 [Photobacterium aphoticum]